MGKIINLYFLVDNFTLSIGLIRSAEFQINFRLNFHKEDLTNEGLFNFKRASLWSSHSLISTFNFQDNVGLLVEPHNYQNVRKILLTNDLTESVMKEIVENQVNFVITYHPLIFSGMKRIVSTDWKSRIISECFAKGIAIFSPHTSWDAAENGKSSTWALLHILIDIHF